MYPEELSPSGTLFSGGYLPKKRMKMLCTGKHRLSEGIIESQRVFQAATGYIVRSPLVSPWVSVCHPDQIFQLTTPSPLM